LRLRNGLLLVVLALAGLASALALGDGARGNLLDRFTKRPAFEHVHPIVVLVTVIWTAQALGLSPRTAARLWTYARAVLYRDLSDPA